MRNFLLLVILVICLPQAFGQTIFLLECKGVQDGFSSTYSDQIKWLMKRYKSDSCQELAKRLKQATSFTDFVSDEKNYKSTALGFDDVPEMIDPSINQIDLKVDLFENLKLFSEFKNLTHFFTTGGGVCDVLEKHQWINRVTIRVFYSGLKKQDEACIKKYGLEVLIVGHFIPDPQMDPHEMKIIGIQDYQGELDDLIDYKHLKYLGINQMDNKQKLKDLGGLFNLTHLMLSVRDVEGISSLKYLTNLSSLKILCWTCKTAGKK